MPFLRIFHMMGILNKYGRCSLNQLEVVYGYCLNEFIERPDSDNILFAFVELPYHVKHSISSEMIVNGFGASLRVDKAQYILVLSQEVKRLYSYAYPVAE